MCSPFSPWGISTVAVVTIKYFFLQQKFSKIMCQMCGPLPKSTSSFFVECILFLFRLFYGGVTEVARGEAL